MDVKKISFLKQLWIVVQAVASAVASSIIGGTDIHIFVFTNHKNNWFQKKLIVQSLNIWISAPPPPQLSSWLYSPVNINKFYWKKVRCLGLEIRLMNYTLNFWSTFFLINLLYHCILHKLTMMSYHFRFCY